MMQIGAYIPKYQCGLKGNRLDDLKCPPESDYESP